MSDTAVLVRSLSKHFGSVRAVDDISFTVAPGEVVGLLGPSGCGKTTTLRCIAGLEEADTGEIVIAGRHVSSPDGRVFVSPEKRGIGMVFQSYALWPHMSVFENVAFPLAGMRDESESTIRQKVTATLERVRLAGLEGRLPSELSGGQQQRVAVARAIAGEPKVLLFDEPLSNLDAKLRNSVRVELKALLAQLGSAAIYVTHDQQEAMALCDRIVVMDHGRIAQEGTPQEIYTRPANRFVAEFVGEANLLKGSQINGAAGGAEGRLKLLRPEDAELSLESSSRAIECVVVQRLYLGAYNEYVLRTTGSNVLVVAYSRLELDPMDRCYLSGPWDELHEVPDR